MESVKTCYICSSPVHETLLVQTADDPMLALIDPSLNVKSRSIVMCSSCGFSFHNPTLENSELDTLYDRYRESSFRGEEPDDYFDRITNIPLESSINYAKTLNIDLLFAQYTSLNLSTEQLRFLDVGTGGGVFIKTFLEHSASDWTAYGVEPSPNYADLASRRLSIEVKNQFFHSGLFSKPFHLITANKVLEHTEDPILFLKGLGSDLVPGGIIYIEVPSIREVFTLPAEHPQLSYDHLIFFSKETLTHVALSAGLIVHEVKELFLDSGEVDLVLVATVDSNFGQPVSYTPVFPLNTPSDFA